MPCNWWAFNLTVLKIHVFVNIQVIKAWGFYVGQAKKIYYYNIFRSIKKNYDLEKKMYRRMFISNPRQETADDGQ